MIYMVEHVIDVQVEKEWNQWYAGYLSKLVKVPGFLAAQRFKLNQAQSSAYMAMYEIASAAVLDSAVYKQSGGGGTASLRFRPAYKYWRRNLFSASVPAPDVPLAGALRVSDQESPDDDSLTWLKAVGLDQSTKFRGIGVLHESQPESPGDFESKTRIYVPITAQLCQQ